jgi:hypothetical protein
VKTRSWTGVRWILVGGLLPLMLLGLYVLAIGFYGVLRYDPAYFATEYAQKYSTPASTAKGIESALQNGDRALMAELQGRRAASLTAMPNLVFVMLEERTARYSTYLYLDRDTYEQYTYHVERVRGRYVVTPPDAYYYLHSGQWREVFVPVAVGWWAVELFFVLAWWFYRLSARRRAEMYGD